VPRLHALYLDDNFAPDDSTGVLRAVLEQRTRTFTAPQVLFRATSRGVLTIPDSEDPAPAPAPTPIVPLAGMFGSKAGPSAAKATPI
jgi:hypothetical protein